MNPHNKQPQLIRGVSILYSIFYFALIDQDKEEEDKTPFDYNNPLQTQSEWEIIIQHRHRRRHRQVAHKAVRTRFTMVVRFVDRQVRVHELELELEFKVKVSFGRWSLIDCSAVLLLLN